MDDVIVVKDANDLLKSWNQEGVEGEEQRRRVMRMLGEAATMVEAAAAWAGGRQGPERDRGMQVVAGMLGKLDAVQLASYRGKLAKALGVSLREFNDLTKAGKSSGKKDERIDITPTLGGYVDGWLIEYIWDPEGGQARLAYRDPDRRIGTAEYLDIEGVRYAPKPVNSFVKSGGVLFPSEVGGLKTTRELVAMVEAFIHQNFLLEARYHGRIISYYVMMSWLYDCFNALPYLRAIGEAGAGKSEMMKRVGHLCYRLMTASGSNTSASFFRASEMYKGTVFIDEADLVDGGDMTNDIVKFLNLGAMRGNPIWRLEEINTEMGKSWEIATFQTYCPKLIAMRREFRDDAVASRALTFKVMPREPMELRAARVSLYIDDEFRRRARAIRNLLLRWRLEHWEEQIEVGEDLMDMEISSRLNQVTMPMKALARDDAELMAEIERFLRVYNQEMVLTKSMTLGARVVEALWKIHSYPDLMKKFVGMSADREREYIMIGDVARVANEIIDEMNEVGEEGEGEEDEKSKRKRKRDNLTARGVGAIIRNELQLQVGTRRGTGFPVYWDQIKMEALAKRYGVNLDNHD